MLWCGTNQTVTNLNYTVKNVIVVFRPEYIQTVMEKSILLFFLVINVLTRFVQDLIFLNEVRYYRTVGNSFCRRFDILK